MQNVIASRLSSTDAAIAAQIGEISVPTVHVSATAKAADIAFLATQKALEQLSFKREAWENGVYRTATIELYTLLADCYAFYKAMEGSSEAAKAKRKALVDYSNVRGFGFRESTHSINRIVACVFGRNDRRRISAYATALKKAHSNGIAPRDLVDFFVKAGGIEEVRTNKSGNALAPKDKAVVAAKSICSSKLGTVHAAELAQQLDAANIGAHTVLLGTWNADGSIDVRAVVNSKGVLNAALASHYSAEKAAREKAAIEAEQKAVDDSKLDAIQAAAAEAVI